MHEYRGVLRRLRRNDLSAVSCAVWIYNTVELISENSAEKSYNDRINREFSS